MHIETRLIILHIDFETGSQKCLLQDGKLPSCFVQEGHPELCCSGMLEECLQIEPEWVSFPLVCIDTEWQKLTQDDGIWDVEVLVIYYTCLIPAVVKNHCGEWADIGSIEDGNIQKIVFQAGTRAYSRF